jgi:hypothetical protein
VSDITVTIATQPALIVTVSQVPALIVTLAVQGVPGRPGLNPFENAPNDDQIYVWRNGAIEVLNVS